LGSEGYKYPDVDIFVVSFSHAPGLFAVLPVILIHQRVEHGKHFLCRNPFRIYFSLPSKSWRKTSMMRLNPRKAKAAKQAQQQQQQHQQHQGACLPNEVSLLVVKDSRFRFVVLPSVCLSFNLFVLAGAR
jgi:hypothetical protein